MNAEKFEQFLNKEQRDPSLNELLYPFYSVQKATELIQKYETDDSLRKKSKFFLFHEIKLIFLKWKI